MKSEKREKEEWKSKNENTRLRFVFENLIEKATYVTLFWNLSRNPDKISSKIRRKMQNSTYKNIKKLKNENSFIHSRKNVDDFGLKFWDLSGAKVFSTSVLFSKRRINVNRINVNLVDLVKSFPTTVYLQKSASITPRTSPWKFAER